jgi:UDP-N-acetylglucosamine diphosphorylase/glucosamine-1-phosphate N-acetyltransferase
MKIVLFDDDRVIHLKPFTLTRPAADIRCGILTIAEKWSTMLSASHSYICADYLSTKYPYVASEDSMFINGRALPSAELVSAIHSLKLNEAIACDDVLIAYRAAAPSSTFTSTNQLAGVKTINRIHNIFTYNHAEIEADFALITAGKTSATLSATNTVFGKHPIFVEEGVKAEAAVFNTNDGPIYLGKNSEVMEGALIRGPFALCESAGVKMGAKIYTGTTVGPHSKVGGEVSNSVIFGYSNKGHDGFLGNSVLGEWCNLGADSNNSNLKNNYEEVKLWNYATGNFERTGLQFCGLFMGDHSKCGINTMFNTGTVVGVSSNIFGSGFPRNFVPSFAWGGSQGFETYMPKKAFQTAEKVMERRHVTLEESDKNILSHIFEEEVTYRNWEKS